MMTVTASPMRKTETPTGDLEQTSVLNTEGVPNELATLLSGDSDQLLYLSNFADPVD